MRLSICNLSQSEDTSYEHFDSYEYKDTASDDGRGAGELASDLLAESQSDKAYHERDGSDDQSSRQRFED